MMNQRIIIKLLGIIMAITGAVIIIHTVPVFIWYFILLGLVLILGVLFFFQR